MTNVPIDGISIVGEVLTMNLQATGSDTSALALTIKLLVFSISLPHLSSFSSAVSLQW